MIRFWAGVTLLVWLPALLLTIALTAPRTLGCRVEESQAHPCPVAGMDIGGMLNAFFVQGWLLMVTLPLMLMSLVFWTIWAVSRWRSRRRA